MFLDQQASSLGGWLPFKKLEQINDEISPDIEPRQIYIIQSNV